MIFIQSMSFVFFTHLSSVVFDATPFTAVLAVLTAAQAALED